VHSPPLPPPVCGQANPRPPTGFVNHSLVVVDGAYYDPALGIGPIEGDIAEVLQRWERATMGACLFDEIRDGVTNHSASFTGVPGPHSFQHLLFSAAAPRQ
jgi:hypothetical protein